MSYVTTVNKVCTNSLIRKCYKFDNTFVTDCTKSYHWIGGCVTLAGNSYFNPLRVIAYLAEAESR